MGDGVGGHRASQCQGGSGRVEAVVVTVVAVAVLVVEAEAEPEQVGPLLFCTWQADS